MMDVVFTWRELLLAIVLASLIYLLESFVFLKWRRKNKSVSLPEFMKELNRLASELEGLRMRLDTLENTSLDSRSGEAVEAASIFDRAVQYAKEGMLPQEIVSRTGLSLSEVTLIVTMYKQGR